MSALDLKKFLFDETRLFIHYQDNYETAVILNYEDDATVYFRLTNFGADVVRVLQKHPGLTRAEILSHLCPLYNGTEENIDDELNKVLLKLVEHELI